MNNICTFESNNSCVNTFNSRISAEKDSSVALRYTGYGLRIATILAVACAVITLIVAGKFSGTVSLSCETALVNTIKWSAISAGILTGLCLIKDGLYAASLDESQTTSDRLKILALEGTITLLTPILSALITGIGFVH